MEFEGYIGASEGQAPHHPFDMVEFGTGGAKEFASGGEVEKKIPHLDRRPRRARRGLDLRMRAAVDFEAGAGGGVVRTTGDRKSRNGGDARQGFPAKAHTVDTIQIAQGRYFAGGMARQSEFEFFSRNADAVIPHSDQTATPAFDLDFDGIGPGIDGILDQLLDHGRRPLHDLARGDLIGQYRGQNPNRRDLGDLVEPPLPLVRRRSSVGWTRVIHRFVFKAAGLGVRLGEGPNSATASIWPVCANISAIPTRSKA